MYKGCVLLRLLAFVLALLAAQQPSWAQELELGLELTAYEAPDALGCPSREAFTSEIRDLVGRDPFAISSESNSLRVAVVLTEEGSTFSGSLQAAAEDGGPERRFLASSCEELAAAIALAIAIAVGPIQRLEPREERSRVKKPAARASVPAAPGPTTTPARELEWSLFIEPLLLWGATPARNNALAVGLSVRSEALSLHIRMQGSNNGVGDVAMDQGQVDARLLNLGLSPCWRRAWLTSCASLSMGSIRARGLAPLEGPKTESRAFFAAGLRAYFRVARLDRLDLRWFVDGQATLLKTRIVVGDTGAWQSPAFVVGTGIHIGLKFL